jgi:peptidoglycan/LPS O-acetylase OafA/YrhL
VPSPLPARAPSATSYPPRTDAHRRLDIQGLRAVAVLMVVAFHAGLPLPGGFVGVDIFFVISGFVITGMLVREWAVRGRIDFARFYLRRFKRLTPALAVTVGATVVMAGLVLSPLGPQQVTAQTAVGAMLLMANVVIAKTTGDYFDAPAEENPLLNTWSLSVEEQFYLGFPLILTIGWLVGRRLGRSALAPLVAVTLVGVTSFGLTLMERLDFFGPDGSSVLGFYSPITRAWEFAAGSILALVSTGARAPSRVRALILSLVGAALLVASLGLITTTTPFPGVWTLLPVLGTVLLLAGGAHHSSPATRFLRTRPMVNLGDWSYSIYLWHWPFIVLASAMWPHVPLIALVAAGASIAPALASYYWVEQPIRQLQGLTGAKVGALVTATVVPPLLLAGSMLWVATDFWRPRFESGQMPVAFQGDIGHTEFHAFIRDTYYPCTPPEIREHAPTWEGQVRCFQSQPGQTVDVALMGDSHAEHLFPGLAAALPDLNVAYYIVGDSPTRASPDFSRILDHISATDSIKGVILTNRWASKGVPETGFTEALSELSGGGRKVYVTDGVPAFAFDPFRCKYESPLLAPPECTQDASEFWGTYAGYVGQLEEAVSRVPGVELLNTARSLCSDSTCDMTRGRELLYRDRHHLNLNGSRYVAQQIMTRYPDVMDALAGGRSAQAQRDQPTGN